MTNNLSQEYKIEKIKDDLIDKVREEGGNITTGINLRKVRSRKWRI